LGYYTQNEATLNAVGVDSGKGPVLPSKATVLDGSYSPLSRILAIYAAKSALDKPQTKAFLEFIIGDSFKAQIEDPSIGYVDLPDSVYAAAKARIESGTVGSVLSTAKPGTKAEDLFH
jgi:phosphate transport system substrate-binding protein